MAAGRRRTDRRRAGRAEAETGETPRATGALHPAMGNGVPGNPAGRWVVVPIDMGLKRIELRHILTHSETRVLFCGREQWGGIAGLAEKLPALDLMALVNAVEGGTPDGFAREPRGRLPLLPLHALNGTGKVTFSESLKKLADNLEEVRPSFFVGVPAFYRLVFERVMKKIEGNLLSRMFFAFPSTRPLVVSPVRRKLGAGTVFISGGAALDPGLAGSFACLGITSYQGVRHHRNLAGERCRSPGRQPAGDGGKGAAGRRGPIRESRRCGTSRWPGTLRWGRVPNELLPGQKTDRHPQQQKRLSRSRGHRGICPGTGAGAALRSGSGIAYPPRGRFRLQAARRLQASPLVHLERGGVFDDRHPQGQAS